MPPMAVREVRADDVDGGNTGFVEENMIVDDCSTRIVSSRFDGGEVLAVTMFLSRTHQTATKPGVGVTWDGYFKILVANHI